MSIKERYSIEKLRVRFGYRRADDSHDDLLRRVEDAVWRRIAWIEDQESKRFWQTYVGMIEDKAHADRAFLLSLLPKEGGE